MKKLEIWIQFANEADYKSKEEELDALFSDDGARVVIYLSEAKEIKRLSERKTLNAENCGKARALVGDDNVKIVTKEKDLENKRSFHFPDRPEVSLERIADALEGINNNLGEMKVTLDSIDKNIDGCISCSRDGRSKYICITGDVYTN